MLCVFSYLFSACILLHIFLIAVVFFAVFRALVSGGLRMCRMKSKVRHFLRVFNWRESETELNIFRALAAHRPSVSRVAYSLDSTFYVADMIAEVDAVAKAPSSIFEHGSVSGGGARSGGSEPWTLAELSDFFLAYSGEEAASVGNGKGIDDNSPSNSEVGVEREPAVSESEASRGLGMSAGVALVPTAPAKASH